MIQHIFKIIWNERKLNAWLLFEYIIVFCVLWFCCDYLYTTARNYYGPSGFDINNTYVISMGEKSVSTTENNVAEIDKYALATTFLERVKRHPDIENVALAESAVPYISSIWMSGYLFGIDSTHQTIRERYVSSEFFDVFKMNIRQGRTFNWQDIVAENEIVISPIRNNYFGGINKGNIPMLMSEVRTLQYSKEVSAERPIYTVVGTTDMIRDAHDSPYMSNAIHPLKRKDVNLSRNQIAIRTKPGTEKDFINRFTKDMREQLFIGQYFLVSITSVKDIRTQNTKRWGTADRINSTIAITAFLIVNIFIGILGSFWFRTQTRRSEIGLRAALGSSKRQVRGLLVLETLFLLSISSVVATIICLSIGATDIINTLGIPTFDKHSFDIGSEQYVINFVITFLFLAIVSTLAVWYPAKQASDIQPAEALHDE